MVNLHEEETRLAHNHVGFVLGTSDTTVRLNAIGSVLIYYAALWLKLGCIIQG